MNTPNEGNIDDTFCGIKAIVLVGVVYAADETGMVYEAAEMAPRGLTERGD